MTDTLVDRLQKARLALGEAAGWGDELKAIEDGLRAALGSSVPSPSPDADVLRERFKRALDKLLYAHGEWASCRSGDLQRETLADKAVAAENVVLALYADSLGAPAPPADPR